MDFTSPYVISIVDLPRQEGSSRVLDLDVVVPAEVGLELLSIPEGDPLDLDIQLQSVSEGIFVTGSVSAHAVGQCSRCLTPIEMNMTEQIGELVFYPERKHALLDEGDEEAEDFPEVVEDHIDLEPIIRDAIVLAMPFRPLCKPDCAGLCPGCGERWEDLPEDHHHETTDSRFAELDALAAQLSKEENER